MGEPTFLYNFLYPHTLRLKHFTSTVSTYKNLLIIKRACVQTWRDVISFNSHVHGFHTDIRAFIRPHIPVFKCVSLAFLVFMCVYHYYWCDIYRLTFGRADIR